MTSTRSSTVTGGLAALVIAATATIPSARVQSVAHWRVTSGTVTVNCPLTVGGSFDAKTSSLEGQLTLDPGRPRALAGELAVDLATLDTGIDLRNTHLRDRYLEVGKGPSFARATIKAIELERPASGFSGTTRFTAELTVHGVTKPVSGEVRLQAASSGTRVQASFPVHLPDYQIAKPRYLGVGVKDEVQVKVSFEAADSGSK
jgi:polyisoprenoid-binding protein YceI